MEPNHRTSCSDGQPVSDDCPGWVALFGIESKALGFNLLNRVRQLQKDSKNIKHASYIQCERVVDDFSRGWKLA
jgi:hypothetical protein